MVDDKFCMALDYDTYHLIEMSSLCGNQVSKHLIKFVSMLQVQKDMHIFDPVNPIQIVGILYWIRIVCGPSSIREGIDISFYSYFIKKTTTGEAMARLSLQPKSSH